MLCVQQELARIGLHPLHHPSNCAVGLVQTLSDILQRMPLAMQILHLALQFIADLTRQGLDRCKHHRCSQLQLHRYHHPHRQYERMVAKSRKRTRSKAPLIASRPHRRGSHATRPICSGRKKPTQVHSAPLAA